MRLWDVVSNEASTNPTVTRTIVSHHHLCDVGDEYTDPSAQTVAEDSPVRFAEKTSRNTVPAGLL